MNDNVKLFNPLNVSSKFAICGLPIRVDTYKTCTFGCEYCFSNNRVVGELESGLQIGNVFVVENLLDRIFNKKEIKKDNFLDVLVSNRYDWHLGGMSDPLQPIEKHYHVTRDLINITNKYNIHILISTKSADLCGCNFKPDLHAFQLSVSNISDRKDIEPNVPDIKERLKFFQFLKSKGFKVGIRIQPFIPNITTIEIIDMFHDADNFTIEGIKLVPQNEAQKEKCLKLMGLEVENFKQMGLLNLKPELRLKLYAPFIEKLDKYKIPYSISDNDLHHIGTNKCCCGDCLVNKSTTFNNTYLLKTYGNHYTKENVEYELEASGISDCKCYYVFTSNRQEGCKTVKEFYDKRFYRDSSIFSPGFIVHNIRKELF